MLSFLSGRTAQIATLLLLVQIGVYYGFARTEVIPPTPPWQQFPPVIGNYRMQQENSIGPEELDKLRPDDYIERVYQHTNGADWVGLFIGYFKSRRSGYAPHSPQWCLPGAGWTSVAAEDFALPVQAEEGAIPVKLYTIEKARNRLLIIYWYQQNKRSFADELKAQFYSVPELLLHGRTDVAIIRITLPIIEGAPGSARTKGIEFAQALYPLIRKHIP
jgi:EpsI family protein